MWYRKILPLWVSATCLIETQDANSCNWGQKTLFRFGMVPPCSASGVRVRYNSSYTSKLTRLRALYAHQVLQAFERVIKRFQQRPTDQTLKVFGAQLYAIFNLKGRLVFKFVSQFPLTKRSERGAKHQIYHHYTWCRNSAAAASLVCEASGVRLGDDRDDRQHKQMTR